MSYSSTQDVPCEFGFKLSPNVYTYLVRFLQYTDPPSALGFWIALEKCTASNGALSFLPGSHLTTRVTKRFVRLGENKGTGFERLVSPEEEKKLSEAAIGEYILETCNPGWY